MVAGTFMRIVLQCINSPPFIWRYNKSEHCKNVPLFQAFSSKQEAVKACKSAKTQF